MCKRTILTHRPAELPHERNEHHPTLAQTREPVHDARCAMSTAAPRMRIYPVRPKQPTTSLPVRGCTARMCIDARGCTSYSSSVGGAVYHIPARPTSPLR
ncbi:hypothetical protein B0H13DRAFT_2340718 [Mycena leptocephala]|nr:hypothetical protein B0H13DRAFT_2340718 [Mycena leptocephala]